MFEPGFDYSFLLADHTQGGILVAWQSTVWSLSSVLTHTYSLLAYVLQVATGAAWLLPMVYGPSREEEKDDFLQELLDLSRSRSGAWLITGDLNMIYRAQDKNNTRLD
jgi:hypothetical protein